MTIPPLSAGLVFDLRACLSLGSTGCLARARVFPRSLADAPFFAARAVVSNFEVIEPATGERLASIPRASVDDVDRAARAARRAVTSGAWRTINTRERGRILLRVANLIREHREELARAESRNVGKPIRDARDEVDLAADCF